MIALIEIIRQDLPIVFAFHGVGVIEDIILKVETIVSFLLVDILKMLFPRHFRSFFGVQVDVDETVNVSAYVNWKQAILGFVESF